MKIRKYPLQRNGIPLYLDCSSQGEPTGNILLIHGVTYSSREFDINYEDYSLVRKLTSEGYAVWRIDIAGYGQSGAVEDGFMPDSGYAAADVDAAVIRILKGTGENQIDVLGWSWGTVTAARFAINHPELVNKLVLFAPILSGIGKQDVPEPFHHNTWKHAAEDFQRDSNGSFDTAITDPVVVDLWCSMCWHYDGEYSPNAGRREICTDEKEILIDLPRIAVPTLIICGDRDPYLNDSLASSSLKHLPEGSSLEIMEGAGHCIFLEKPFYRDFQNRLIAFLKHRR